MSLRFKLIGAFLVAVLAAGALAGTSLFATWSLGDIAKAMYDKPFQAINFARAAQSDFLILELEERLSVGASEDNLQRLREDFFLDLDVALERRMSERTKELATKIEREFNDWWKIAMAARADPQRVEERDRIAERVKTDLDILVQTAAEDGYRFWLAAEDEVDQTRRFIIWILIGVLLVSLLVAALLARDIIRPLNRLGRRTIELASGDRSIKVDPKDLRRGDEIGGMARSLMVFRDVMTEVREARDTAEAAAKAKSDFLAMMSHEIRTPMNGVIGMTRLLLRKPLGKEERHFAETVLESAEGLMHLLNGILDFSKLEAGKLDLEVLDFDLRRLIEGSLALMQGRAEEKGLSFSTEIDADCPAHLKGDSARLRQILLNLVGNGLKFTESGGVTIAVAPGAQPGFYRFAVSDTGIGIPEDKLGRLFQEFSQADNSTARQYGGTGLGLAICKQLVELMGGTIGVDSVAGEGSTFWFELPLALGEAPDENADAVTATLPPLSLLVAEDNLVNQQVARGLLEAEGHTLRIVGDGAAALAAIEIEPAGTFDAILMDMNMPGMDGLEATRRIRALPPPRSDIPILAATAAATAEEISRCMEAGMDGYVAKPIHPGLLFEALARVLGPVIPETETGEDLFPDAGDAPPPASPVAEKLMQDGPALEPEVLDTYRAQLGDDFAAEMVTDFLSGLGDHSAAISGHLAAQDAAALGEAAHTLKSAAASVGLRRVYRDALSLETAAGTLHVDEYAAAAERLLAALEESRTLLESQAAQ
ncbi:ATP-binding protein [Nisaea acidiphila]|uniref:Sensory/regulatory protein RpfC n=1 Tax=Nisaea acidiphila TaxID=1862145 RepID=A0A9J7AWP6_9PROT|nr:ATP-binding protein [Nisaea acidiphila]UUX51218.1 ATP-binding protein [Nisaea acidiphila]